VRRDDGHWALRLPRGEAHGDRHRRRRRDRRRGPKGPRRTRPARARQTTTHAPRCRRHRRCTRPPHAGANAGELDECGPWVIGSTPGWGDAPRLPPTPHSSIAAISPPDEISTSVPELIAARSAGIRLFRAVTERTKRAANCAFTLWKQ
jgi:hypothetical protein